jgi:hypothetical protein
MMVNSKTELRIFPGALHGFIDFEGLPFMQEGWNTVQISSVLMAEFPW